MQGAQDNYHPAPWSLGVDFTCTGDTVDTTDLDGNPRIVDLTSIPNLAGAIVDAGAHEVQYVCAADELFWNGFEH